MNARKEFVEWGMKNKAFPLALVFILFASGIYSLLNMPRDEFPDFTLRNGLIVGVYPGASSQQVEEQLTSKVEEYFFGFDEVDKAKTYSYSRDGMMYLYLTLEGRVDHNATEQFWNKIKNGLPKFQRAELPEGVEGLSVNSDFANTAAIIFAVESKTRPYKDLERHVKAIEDELRQIESMAKISHSGELTEQVSIRVDHNKLAQYGLTAGKMKQVLQDQTASYPTGTLEGKNFNRPVHLSELLKNENDIARQVIRTDEDGKNIRFRDVASIQKEYEKPDSYITSNGTKSMIITLEMDAGNNIVSFGEEVDKRLNKLREKLPSDIKITKIANQPEVVRMSVNNFLQEFASAVLGVIIVTLILLPFRIASVAAATIPVTIISTLAVMYFFGLELNTVTIAALVVVLGIVIDDPVVIIENHVQKLDEGQSVWEAARNSTVELFPSVLTSTLTISATFLPLTFFMTGMADDFIRTFPLTIVIALFLSLSIALLIVPYICTQFIKSGLQKKQKKKDKTSLLERVQSFFDNSIEKAMRYYRLTMVIGLASVILGIFIFGLLDQELFPVIERDQFAIEINLAGGNNLKQTDSIVKEFEKVLEQEERIVSYTSFIGTSSPRFHTLYAPKLPSEDYAQILVNTTSKQATLELLREYDRKYADMFPSAYLRMKQLNMIPNPAPVEVRLYGEDLSQLKKLGDEIIELARATPNTIWTRTNFWQMNPTISLDINTEEADRLGLTRANIANTVAMNLEGITAARIWEEEYPIEVKIKSENYNNQKVSDLRELSVIVPQTGGVVPLRQVAQIEQGWVQEQIVRRNGVRCLTVRVDIKKDAIAEQVRTNLDAKIKKMELPNDVRLEYGGEYQLQQEHLTTMIFSLSISVLLISVILIWHFKKFKHALLAFITMPLSILGAVLGLFIMGYPFGFTSFVGVLALCGIVVRYGIIIIDYADIIREEDDLSTREAALRAAKRRMRPIFLTSSSASVGVIPMILSGSPLWGPLGTVIAFGLAMSMILILFVVPVLYWLFFRSKDQSKKEVSHDH